MTSRSTVTSPPAESSARYLTLAGEPLWTIAAPATVVVSVSLVAGDGDGEEAAASPLAPPLEAAAAMTVRHARPRTAQNAVRRTARAGNDACRSDCFMATFYDGLLRATCVVPRPASPSSPVISVPLSVLPPRGGGGAAGAS